MSHGMRRRRGELGSAGTVMVGGAPARGTWGSGLTPRVPSPVTVRREGRGRWASMTKVLLPARRWLPARTRVHPGHGPGTTIGEVVAQFDEWVSR